MRVLLTGAGGQLGQALQATAPIGIELVARRREQLDLADISGLHRALHDIQPGLVINAGAWTAVDRAETNQIQAWRVNAEAVSCLADYCAQNACRLVQLSTDFVFSGDSRIAWPTDAPTSPVNVYGKSKLAGEHAALSSGANARIIRSGWIYSEYGQNFVLTMLRLARERDLLKVVNDQIGTPTWTHTLANFVWQLTADWPIELVWHYADAGQTSWYDFAIAIFAEAVSAGLLERAPRVEPVSSADYAALARRPAFSVLDTSRTLQRFGVEPPEWRQSLRAMLARLAASPSASP